MTDLWRTGVPLAQRKEEVCFYQYEGHVIWGLTAKLMRAFADVVRDRETGYEKHV